MPANIRANLIAISDEARSIIDQIGLRVTSVSVVSVSRGTGLSSLATAGTETALVLSPTPRVKDAPRWQGGLSGQIEAGDIFVDRISATYTRAQLDPTGDAYWDVGGKQYTLIKLEEMSTEWKVQLRRKSRNR